MSCMGQAIHAVSMSPVMCDLWSLPHYLVGIVEGSKARSYEAEHTCRNVYIWVKGISHEGVKTVWLCDSEAWHCVCSVVEWWLQQCVHFGVVESVWFYVCGLPVVSFLAWLWWWKLTSFHKPLPKFPFSPAGSALLVSTRCICVVSYVGYCTWVYEYAPRPLNC